MELFKLGSSSRRPDSERLLYQSGHQVLRPPTAPLTPNAPPLRSADSSSPPWFAAGRALDAADGLPPPPSQPPTLNLFESLNSSTPAFDDAPEYCHWGAADARLSHIVDYLQQRSDAADDRRSSPRLPHTPGAADWLAGNETNTTDADDDDEDDDAPTPAPGSEDAVYPPFVVKGASVRAAQRLASPTARSSPTKSGGASSRHRASAHARAPVKGWWKTEICKFWKESGGCRNENNCRWAHGDHELRSPTPEPGDSASSVHPWVVIDQFPTDLQTVWEILKIKNRSMRIAEENALIAGPAANIELDNEYWTAIQRVLSKDRSAVCDCCGAATSSDHPRVCSTCCAVAAEKVQTMSLVPQASGGGGAAASPAHNDRKKLVYWGLSLANLLKNLDELMWVQKDRQLSLVLDFNGEVSHWEQHKRMVARAVLLMRYYLESLPAGRRTRLLTTELLPSLSLIDWCVVSNQPILYISLVANEFPIQASLPASVACHPFTKKSAPTGS